jgi:hypothetical protein
MLMGDPMPLMFRQVLWALTREPSSDGISSRNSFLGLDRDENCELMFTMNKKRSTHILGGNMGFEVRIREFIIISKGRNLNQKAIDLILNFI